MADSYIVPPIDASEDALRIFYDQICEYINNSSQVLVDTGLTGATGGDGTTEIPKPSGVQANGGFSSVQITFAMPTYSGHSQAIIIRGDTTVYEDASPVGSTATDVFTDMISTPELGKTYYYWVVFQNIGGATGEESDYVSTFLAADVDYSVDILLGKLGYDQFAVGTFPVRCVDVLPSLPDADYPVGSLVLLTTSSKTYENIDNATWTYPPVNVPEATTDTIVAGKLAVGALVVDDGVIQDGYIKSAHIDEAEINTAQIFYIDANKINAGTIDVSLVLNAAEINSPDINAGTVDGSVITGGTIQTNSTPSSSGGIRMTGNTLTIYDTNGSVRVILGDLS